MDLRPALIAAVILIGCGPPPPTTTTERSDSAGVTIVTNGGPDRLATVDATLVNRLGGEPSGPEAFYRLYPRWVGIGRSGTIGVVDVVASRAVTFTPEGELMAIHGREGDGPGEFRYPSSIAVHPDGDVLVYDYKKQALVRFGADGAALDERRLSIPFNGVGMVATEDGLILLSDERPRGDGTTTRRILHLSPRDTVQLGPTVESSTATVYYESCGIRLSLPPVFGADLIWASDGSRTAVAASAHYSIQIFDGTTLVHVLRRDVVPETATDAVARREIGDGEPWATGGQECLVPPREVIEQRGYAEEVPLVEGLAITPEGDLWVRRRVPGTPDRAVDVFDREGRYLHTLTPAPPFPIAFLPDGRYLTIEADSFDVETLGIYRLGG